MSVAFVTMHLLLFTYVRQLSFHAHAYSCMANSFDDDEFISKCLPTRRLDEAAVEAQVGGAWWYSKGY